MGSDQVTSAPLSYLDLSRSHPIVFFDGECGLCNGAVDWLMARDPRARFRFAPLQGSTAQSLLKEEDTKNLNSIVVLENGRLRRKSDAALFLFARAGLGWAALAPLLRLIPSFLRDLVYDFIAHRRYAWFGRKETCRLPTPAERARFLP